MKSKILLIALVTLVLIVYFPKINLGQAPDLGSTSSFGLFTAVGAFNNIGETNATGDIGTNAGAFTGFPPGTVDGQIHVADATSAQAATDVAIAYTNLSGITCDTTLITPLGNGQILTPGVYCLTIASTLNGDLTLDGQDNPDALFIIKINGALSASTFSNVILINSASWSNVYWQIGGQFDLGDGSVFNGTAIVDGAINLYEGSSVFGRALSRAGAISLFNNTMQPASTLPIELLNFIAHPAGENVQLDWLTASETNNDYFTIQRSNDGISFEELQRKQGAGNSNSVLYYSAVDRNPYDGISYYRLMQTDFDGKHTYSNIVTVDVVRQLVVDYETYPNPFSTSTTFTINDASEIIKTDLRIYNILGEEVLNKSITTPSTVLKTNNLPSGIYYYSVFRFNKIIHSGKMVSQQ